MDFTPQEKAVLQSFGKGSQGKSLIEILKRLRNHMTSVENIPAGGDTAAQVEGRKMFIKFADSITNEMTKKDRERKDIDEEDYE